MVDKNHKIVNVDIQELTEESKSNCLTSKIENAFGEKGLGILTISNVPNLVDLRNKLLLNSFEFANLPANIKSKYKHHTNAFGWDVGSEKLNNNQFDIRKGSYYANIYSGSLSEYETDKEEFADFISENIWPTNELPDFETSFNDLVENCIRDSVNNKGRLLHYFPLSQENSPSLNCNSDSWCGLHNDHSALTGLTSPMYLENGQIREGEFRDVGLYIYTRNGDIVKAEFRPDQLAFQIGESAEIMSAGYLQATPHCVKCSTSLTGVTREMFAVFLQPSYFYNLTYPSNIQPKEHLSSALNIPRISNRFQNGDSFATFARNTISKYY